MKCNISPLLNSNRSHGPKSYNTDQVGFCELSLNHSVRRFSIEMNAGGIPDTDDTSDVIPGDSGERLGLKKKKFDCPFTSQKKWVGRWNIFFFL